MARRKRVEFFHVRQAIRRVKKDRSMSKDHTKDSKAIRLGRRVPIKFPLEIKSIFYLLEINNVVVKPVTVAA